MKVCGRIHAGYAFWSHAELSPASPSASPIAHSPLPTVCRVRPDLFRSLGPWSRAPAWLVRAPFLPLQSLARDVSTPSPARLLPCVASFRAASVLVQMPVPLTVELSCRACEEVV